MDIFVRDVLQDERSRTFRAIHGEITEWSVDRILLASAVNAIRILHHSFLRVNSEKPDQIPPPDLIEIPGAEKAVEQSAAERFMAEMQAVPAADLATVRAFASNNDIMPS